MAKKSKAKKRKQANKRVSKQTIRSTESPSKNITQASNKTVKPTKKPQHTTPKETVGVDEMLSENPPREVIGQKGLIIALGVVVILMLGLLWFIYGKAQQATLETQKAAQEQLLKVNEASGDSLGPTTGSSTTNPQPSTTPADNPTGTGADLQPQQQTSPAQLNQLQQ
ncbi:hypothetical protein H0W80_00385 [Candidatus Saccharibacteria bacterium]|nr:hypothetical protein [Candidatus Saccharibacteria bacterium]